MSDTLARLFEHSSRLHDSRDTVLEDLVRKEVASLLASDVDAPQSDTCLVENIGAFVLRANELLLTTAERLTDGPHIDAFTKEKMEEWKLRDDLSVLDPLFDLDKKHAGLRAMVLQLKQNLVDIEGIWSKVRAPDKLSPSRSREGINRTFTGAGQSSASPQLHHPFPSESWSEGPSVSHNTTHENLDPMDFHQDVTSHESTSMLDEPVSGTIDTEGLKSRGKGTYYCPQWPTCDKGGMRDGKPVVFERNCFFRAHLDRHEKPYQCPESGCQKSYSRSDHLQRHQRSAHKTV